MVVGTTHRVETDFPLEAVDFDAGFAVNLAVGGWEAVIGDVEQVCGARDIGEVSAGESEIHSDSRPLRLSPIEDPFGNPNPK